MLQFRRAADAAWRRCPCCSPARPATTSTTPGRSRLARSARAQLSSITCASPTTITTRRSCRPRRPACPRWRPGTRTRPRPRRSPSPLTRPISGGSGERPFLPNVGIHAHVLPSGLVLMWGRRDSPQQSLDTDPASPLGPGSPPAPAAQCTPFLWNPANGDTTPTPQPTLDDAKTNANLFCSGHAFLPDGRLLVAGGHLADSHGLNQVSIYDPAANTWTPSAVMNNGRWYPTAITLPDGSVLVLSGSYFDPAQRNRSSTTPCRRYGATAISRASPRFRTGLSIFIPGCTPLRPAWST